MVALRLAAVVLGLAFSGCVSTGVSAQAAGPAAGARALNAPASRPTLAQVREQLRAHSPDAAATLDAYLRSTGPGRDRRTALELGVFYHLSEAPRGRDLAAARRLLTELLAAQPKPQRQAEFTVIAGLVDGLIRLEAEAEAHTRSTRAELASMRRQIDHLEEGVRARDELLKKVADVVVSAKPKS